MITRGSSMELRHLETLLAIAEEGSFTAAADALATVQSNVSDQVRQLERELGVPLLVRSRRGAEPTEFGLLVLDRARRVERELARAVATEPVNDRRLAVEPLLEEDLIGLIGPTIELPQEPVPLAVFAQ